MLKERTGAEFFPAVNVKAIDTTAAGDAFIAGMIWSLSEGKSLRESVRVANEVAAYAVTILGAQSSLPTREAARTIQASAEKYRSAPYTQRLYQVAEKRPSAALSGRLTVLAAWQGVAPYSSRRHPSSFPVSSTGQACCGVLVQVRVVCQFLGLRISGALHLGIFEQPAKNEFFSNGYVSTLFDLILLPLPFSDSVLFLRIHLRRAAGIRPMDGYIPFFYSLPTRLEEMNETFLEKSKNETFAPYSLFPFLFKDSSNSFS